MPLIGLSILIQLLCAVHCVRQGRNQMWLMVIIFLSIPGCLAYALFEIFPYMGARREVRAVKAAAIRRIDPDREVRRAREALELADTAANRTALGDALAETGAWREAADHYRRALAKSPGEDRPGRVRLGRALLESGDPAGAKRELETLPPTASQAENDRAALLLARVHDDLGESEAALALYSDLGRRMAGGEALCRQAALLIAKGRRPEARAALEEVAARVKRLDRMERLGNADMYDWAARTLAELRGP
ncbi:MAG: hypothetical protein QOE79_1910 [Sphingomonadales bacterium]|jgi:hypothetical protein|nr:hypothetical protein [Sphingomonadales bacterium]MEA3050788.1 hypothetical protein [Sphingomonadales bacterium]